VEMVQTYQRNAAIAANPPPPVVPRMGGY
jgi:hypothetical protein